jgi:hypothetical protein
MAPGGAGGVIAFAAMFTGSVNHEGREVVREGREDNTIIQK